MSDTIIIGGGAAGFFAAARLLELNADIKVSILEQSDKVLQKVKVSGGGRCNVTNAVFQRDQMDQYYPRGWKLMRKLLSRFSHQDTIDWFESKGVQLYTQDDNRMFPQTDLSQTIIDCLTGQVHDKGGELKVSSKMTGIKKKDDRWMVTTIDGLEYSADNVLLATGSSKYIYQLLQDLHVGIVAPLPSLFTFNIDSAMIKGLEGLSVPNAMVRVTGSRSQSQGPLLITHWGLSGPAILKLSSWAARELHGKEYKFSIAVNWIGTPVKDAGTHLERFRELSGKKKMFNAIPFSLPKRLWLRILESAGIDEEKIWPELGKKQFNKLVEQMTNTIFAVNGKSTFKEEFVTCGGVALNEVDPKTMQHRHLQGLYFAGEILDIDAITGGYNFQAAWTTAAVAAESIALK